MTHPMKLSLYSEDHFRENVARFGLHLDKVINLLWDLNSVHLKEETPVTRVHTVSYSSQS